jgi:hypothetical protein
VSVTASPTTDRRAPATVKVASVLLVLLAIASTFGVVMFGFVWNDDPIGAGLVFAAWHLALAVTAVAAIPSLLRGERTGWLLTTGWAFAYTYWSVYKVFGEPEYESWPFLTVGLIVLGLLLAPATRRFVDTR